MTDALSKTNTGKKWLSNFDTADRPAARSLLDNLLLINLNEVSDLIHEQLEELSFERSGKRKAVALYAEREFQQNLIFDVQRTKGANGSVKERAVGVKGPSPVKPIRGGVRVGSEGIIASLISQAVKKHSGILINTPGPDRFRSKRSPISTIAIVTDFIGSGKRLLSMLNKFWNVRTVRSWHSAGLINFVVIAAAATAEGARAVGFHVSCPDVRFSRAVPALDSSRFEQHHGDWDVLLGKFSEESPEDEFIWGFQNSAAMVLFSYGIPNNAPSILWKGYRKIKPLYVGNSPPELRELFWSGSKSEQVERAARERGHNLDAVADVKEQIMLLVLQELRGRYSKKKVRELSERLSFSSADITEALNVAYLREFIDSVGRLTEKGYDELRAQNVERHGKIIVPTNTEPYYPISLRVPKGSSSTCRSKERS